MIKANTFLETYYYVVDVHMYFINAAEGFYVLTELLALTTKFMNFSALSISAVSLKIIKISIKLSSPKKISLPLIIPPKA